MTVYQQSMPNDVLDTMYQLLINIAIREGMRVKDAIEYAETRILAVKKHVIDGWSLFNNILKYFQNLEICGKDIEWRKKQLTILNKVSGVEESINLIEKVIKTLQTAWTNFKRQLTQWKYYYRSYTRTRSYGKVR